MSQSNPPIPTSSARRALIYDRVSSVQQADGYSLATQMQGCRDYCDRKGYAIAGEYEDVFTSTTARRPALMALCEELERGQIDYVVAWDNDRLIGRGADIVQASILYNLQIFTADVEYAKDGTSEQRDELVNGIKRIISRQSNKDRREASVRGQRGRLAAGYPLSSGLGPPYGYRYVASKKQGAYEIEEAEAAVVRDMFHWLIAEGMSSYTIAKRLHEYGIPTRGDQRRAAGAKVKKFTAAGVWSPAVVKKVLNNPVYKGAYTYGTTRRVKRDEYGRKPDGTDYRSTHAQIRTDPASWIVVPVPVIVDAATWQRAQDQLAINKQFAKPAKHEYLLRGMVVCAECGGRWTGAGDTYGGRYRCANARGDKWRSPCGQTYRLRQDRVEPAVWDYVIDELLHPERLSGDVARRRKDEAAQRARYQKKLAALDRDIREIDRKFAALLDQALDGFPAEVIAAKQRELSTQRAMLARLRADTELESSAVVITDDMLAMLEEVARTVQIAAPAMTFAERRQLLRLLRVEVDVIDRAHVRVRGLVTTAVLATLPRQRSQHDHPILLTFTRAIDLTRTTGKVA